MVKELTLSSLDRFGPSRRSTYRSWRERQCEEHQARVTLAFGPSRQTHEAQTLHGAINARNEIIELLIEKRHQCQGSGC